MQHSLIFRQEALYVFDQSEARDDDRIVVSSDAPPGLLEQGLRKREDGNCVTTLMAPK